VRSVNTAYKMGRDIARSIPDEWVADDLLRRDLRRVIGPKINLHRSDEDKSSEAWQASVAMAVVIALVGVVVTALRLLPADVPGLPEWIEPPRQWLTAYPPLPFIGVTASVIILAVLLSIGSRAAAKHASARYNRTVSELHEAAFQGALSVLEGRRRKVGMPIDTSRHRTYLPPSPRPGGVTPRGAEEVVAQWMRHMGEADAELTSYTGDGGMDVIGRRSFAQVKHYSKAVGVAAIRELAGVAANDRHGRHALFFTRVGYAAGAVDFADSAGIALFVYDVERAGLEAMNARAKTLMYNGIS
jgi:hypothetical protein